MMQDNTISMHELHAHWHRLTTIQCVERPNNQFPQQASPICVALGMED